MEAGTLTRVGLAAKTGFRQGFISNFLNGRRGLSLAGMDRILEAEGISLFDLMGEAREDAEYELVPIIAPEHAREVRAGAFAAERLKIRRTLLESLVPSVAGADRWKWERFVLMRLAQEDVEAMHPRLPAECIVLVDRHFNSLAPYRRGGKSMFAVSCEDSVAMRYAEFCGKELVLRCEDPRVRAVTVSVPDGRRFDELVVGRLAYVMAEI